MSRAGAAGKTHGLGDARDPLAFGKVGRELGARKVIKETAGKQPQSGQSLSTPSLSVEMLAGFAWVYLTKHYDNFTPTIWPNGQPGWSPFHVDMWREVCVDDEQIAIAAPREHAKSTAITLAYGLANVLFRTTDYLLIVSDTFEGQAVEIIREYQRELTENDELIEEFRVKKLVKNVEGDIIIMFEDGGLARIKALGMEGPVRGLKWRGKRPGMILLDDCENAELVESKDRRRKSLNWILKDLIPAGRKGCRIRMVGTILHDDAALSRFCKSKSWKSKIYRAHKAFDDFSDILWPEAWPEERLRKRRQTFLDQNNADGYSQEYLNSPISPVDQFLRPEDLTPLEPHHLDIPGDYYIGWDFAVGKEERHDYTAWSILKVDQYRKKYLVEAGRARIDAKEIVELMIQLQGDLKPRCHFVEKGTIEKAIEPFLNDQIKTTERYDLNVVKITRNKDKESFARPLQGMCRLHDLLFNHDMAQWASFQDELTRFPRADHDDMLDSIAIIAQGLRELIEARTPEEESEDEYWDQFRPLSTPEGVPDGRNATTGY